MKARADDFFVRKILCIMVILLMEEILHLLRLVVSAGGSRNDPAGFEDFGGGCGVGGVGG